MSSSEETQERIADPVAPRSPSSIPERAQVVRTLVQVRSGIERRRFSYAAHLPERRSGTDRRVSDDRRRELSRIPPGSRLLKELYDNDWNIEE